jgi:DNA-binding MarR family transcriptional regulator
MAHTSLLQPRMRHRSPQDRRCAYLVVIERGREPAEDLRDLAYYLSTLSVAGCEVIVVDGSPSSIFERNRNVLRWVARHVAARPRHRNFTGGIDCVRTAIDVSNCDKIIVADENVRYHADAIESVCDLLDLHEVVEPQDYFEPLPWWSGIEAGRMLVHRGVEPLPDHGATFGIRKSSVRGLRGVDIAWSNGEDAVRRLASQGAEVFFACDVFVRRLPPPLDHWLRDRPRQADGDFALPVKTAFFFALLPVAILLATFGGIKLAGGYAGAIACASMILAVRGRGGASSFFPLRACLCAPLWVFERSVSVYWALFRKLQGSSTETTHPAVAEGGAGAKVASNL